MASEEASSPPRKFRYEDDQELPSIKKTTSSNALVWIVIIGGGIAVLLLVCIVAGFIVHTAFSNDGTAAKLHGSWQGRFIFGGQVIDAVYTFEQDGNFRQDTLDAQGRVVDVIGGRWRLRGGEIEILWNDGSFERATATWNDRNTMIYHITNHTERAQIGLTATMRRK